MISKFNARPIISVYILFYIKRVIILTHPSDMKKGADATCKHYLKIFCGYMHNICPGNQIFSSLNPYLPPPQQKCITLCFIEGQATSRKAQNFDTCHEAYVT